MRIGRAIGGFINNVIVGPITGIIGGVAGAAGGLISSATPLVTNVANSQAGQILTSGLLPTGGLLPRGPAALGGESSGDRTKEEKGNEKRKQNNMLIIGAGIFLSIILVVIFRPKRRTKT